MDSVSHGLWSYLLWKNLPFAGLAILFGMLPDIIAFFPRFLHNIQQHPKRIGWMQDEKLPKAIRAYEQYAFPLSHSLLISLGVSAIAFTMYPLAWFTFAWPVHILVDIVSHPREKGTPFLWPFSQYKVHSFYWEGKWFLLSNFAALVIAYALVFF